MPKNCMFKSLFFFFIFTPEIAPYFRMSVKHDFGFPLKADLSVLIMFLKSRTSIAVYVEILSLTVLKFICA